MLYRLNTRISQDLARSQSRLTVRVETSRTSVVSFSLNPPHAASPVYAAHYRQRLSPYDTIDGHRFLVRAVPQQAPPLTVIVNWPALLKKGSEGQ